MRHKYSLALLASLLVLVVFRLSESTSESAVCAPLPCSEVLVAAPYTLTFDADHGGVVDGTGIGTGFTYVDPPSNGLGYIPANLSVDTTAGALAITTTAGLAHQSSNSQDNALGVGIAADGRISTMTTSLLSPPKGTGRFEQAGLWFGNNENNFAKFVIQSNGSVTIFEYLIEVNGAVVGRYASGAQNLTDATVELSLRANASNRTIQATYRINGGSTINFGTLTAPAAFFSEGGAGVDPEVGTNTFGGIFASHRSATAPLVYSFGSFAVTQEDVATPVPSPTITPTPAPTETPSPTPIPDDYFLLLSTSPDRSNPVELHGATVNDSIYVFTSPDTSVTSAVFYLDDPAMAGAPFRFEGQAPMDFAGTRPNGTATAYDTNALAEGVHTITASVNLAGGGNVVLSADFTVFNAMPSLQFEGTRPNLVLMQGQTTTIPVTLGTSDGSSAAVTLAHDAAWLTLVPDSGATPLAVEALVDTAGLDIGNHAVTVQASAPGYRPASLNFTLKVVQGYDIVLSHTPDRADPVPLEGQTVSGDIFVFTRPVEGVNQVLFYIDDPLRQGSPHRIEGVGEWDMNGTLANGLAAPYNTLQLADGEHSVTAALKLPGNAELVLTSTFEVENVPPALILTPDTLEFELPEAGADTLTLELTTDDGSTPAFTISPTISWLQVTADTSTVPATVSVTANATGLAPGVFHAPVTIEAEGYSEAVANVTLSVGDTQGCSPIACSLIRIGVPYELTFDVDHGMVLDGSGTGTGFTYIDEPSKGQGYIPGNLHVDTTAGAISIQTTKGLSTTSSNSLDNALGVGIDAPSQVTQLRTTILNPPGGTGAFEQGGLWFGNDEDNYVKMVILSTGAEQVIEYYIEIGGSQAGMKRSLPLALQPVRVQLTLRADPSNRAIQASYSLDGGTEVILGAFTAPGEFFSFDAAGIDPLIGTRSFGGIFASHRNGPSSLTFVFDDFSVTEAPPIVNEPPGPGEGAASPDIGFDKLSFPLPLPTSMVVGPDGRLYVTELFGTVHRITLDENKQVLQDEAIQSVRTAHGGGRLMLGITVDPQSTPENVILWVAHSSPSLDDGVPNSGIVTRVSGPNLEVVEEVITGLPRAKANHSINSLHFGPDGRLYIAQGGNTGAGAPNTANTEFGSMQEQPLSAALLVADVNAAGFDGSCHNEQDIFGPPPCDVTPYATGLRNMYDFVFHTNGELYGPDNGLGVLGSFPPSPEPPCFGVASTESYQAGGHNPGPQPDTLKRIVEGGYYGHPNPYRAECVFANGAYQGVPAPANYIPPIANLGNNKSVNGTIEYLSQAFCGALMGEILVTNYSVGDNITRIRLAEDGMSVLGTSNLIGGFGDPLPLTQGPDGTLYVGEFGASKVTILLPRDVGCWDNLQPLPAQLLDVEGAALGGKFYVLAGKTAAGHQTAMYIYDPATDTWTTGPNLPGPGVEDPAVVAANGLLYVFGGATNPFFGAVTNAAVYNPATGAWTVLAPMPIGRAGAGIAAIGDNIYVAGGMDPNGNSLETMDVYSVSSNSWSAGAPMATRRDNPASAMVDGQFFVFGGRTRNADGSVENGTLNTVEMYDPATGVWEARASMPTGRRAMVAGVLDGRVLVIGGEATSSGGAFPQNEEYDPATDTWRSLKAMKTPRHGAAIGVIDDMVYVAGGGTVSGSSFSDILEVFHFQSELGE